MKRFRSYITIPTILFIGILAVSIYFLYFKLRLGLVRYFDVDELAYLWWASHMQQGVMPYQDFFFYGTPGFLWFLAPVFTLFHGSDPMIVARILMTVVFSALIVTASILFWQIRKSWLAVAVPLFLIFLPLPADKFLEIRPDALSLFFALLGIVLLVHVMQTKTHKVVVGIATFSFACSLVVQQKTLPMIGIAGICFIGWCFMMMKRRELSEHTVRNYILSLIVGFGIVILGTTFWLLGNKIDLQLVWYSLTRLPLEINQIGYIWKIEPTQFFYPNDVFYGVTGYHIGYTLNLSVWIVAILIGIFRFVTPAVPNGKRGIWQELMISGIFLSSLLLYKDFFPMKHTQYLMPSAVFVAWYMVDSLFLLWEWIRQIRFGKLLYFFLWIFLLGVLIQGYWKVNTPKFLWRNTDVIQTVNTLTNTIPLSEPILDLVGLTMYYPQPYYLACLPIGQYTPLMSYVLPSLSKQLETTDTKYIYQGGSQRVSTLATEDQTYIYDHFFAVDGGALFVRNDMLSSYVQRISK